MMAAVEALRRMGSVKICECFLAGAAFGSGSVYVAETLAAPHAQDVQTIAPDYGPALVSHHPRVPVIRETDITQRRAGTKHGHTGYQFIVKE